MYHQHKKIILEHLYAYSGLPISEEKTLDTYKQLQWAARQNKARRKRLLNIEKKMKMMLALKASLNMTV